MKLNRKLATAAVALAATVAGIGATATAASAMAGYEDTFKQSRCSTSGYCMSLDVGVNYNGARSVDVKAVVKDAGGDAYCTAVKARLFDSDGNQLGNIITVGSVCNGQTLALPLKPISTQAGDIASITVYALLGSTTTTASLWDTCWRGADSHNGYLDSCR